MPNYDVFISYSHATERPVAIALQKALSQFAKPWYKLRALRAFRDDASLSANAALWPAIQKALDDSKHFLLLASPESANSEWVQKEIKYWLENNSSDSMLIAHTAGSLSWSTAAGEFDWDNTDAIALGMKAVFSQEPRYLDLRWARDNPSLSLRNIEFRNAVADLAAPLYGRPKDDMIGEDVVQHRRTIRVAWSAAIALGVLLLAALFAGSQALLQRDEALRQRDLALSRQLAASAEIVRSDQIDLSLLLSMHALRYADTAEARSALLAGLQTTAGIGLFLPAETGATQAKFTPDGKRLLVATPSVVESRDPQSGEVKLEFARTTCSGSVLNDFAIHPDGHTIAVAYGDGSVQLWDANNGKPLGGPLVEHQVAESACADYTASLEGTGLWAPSMNAVAFDADGQRLAATNGRGEVFVWALDGAEASRIYGERVPNLGSSKLIGGTMGGTSIDFLPEHYLLVGGIGTLDLVNYERNEYWIIESMLESDETSFYPASHAHALNQPAFIVALAGTEKRSLWGGASEDQEVVRLFMSTFEDDPIRLTADSEQELSIVAISPDKRFVAAGDEAGNLWAWGLARQELIFGPMTTHGGPVSELQFHPVQAHLVSTGEDGSVVTRDLEAAHVTIAITERPHQVQAVSVDFKADDTSVAIAYVASGADKPSSIHLFDYPSLDAAASWDTGADDLVGAKFLGDGAGLLSVTKQGRLSTWVVDSSRAGTPKASFDIDTSVTDFEISNDGQLVAVVGEDGRISVWSIADGAQVDLVTPENGAVAVAFIDSTAILFNDRRKWNFQMHRLASRGEPASVQTAPEPLHFAGSVGIKKIVTDEDSNIAVLGFSAGQVQLVSLQDWRPLGLGTPEHASSIRALALSSDGYIAAANGDEVQLWDSRTMRPIARPFLFDDKFVVTAAYSRDGKRLAVSVLDGKVFFIDVDIANWQSRACAIAHRELTIAEWNEYIGDTMEPRSVCSDR
jgi:WD40 repeat protein